MLGTDGIKLWNIQTSNEVTATTHLKSCDIVSSAVWMKTKYTFAETLCYGTGSGYIVFIRSSPIDVRCVLSPCPDTQNLTEPIEAISGNLCTQTRIKIRNYLPCMGFVYTRCIMHRHWDM